MIFVLGYFCASGQPVFLADMFVNRESGCSTCIISFKTKYQPLDRLREGETAFFEAMTHLLEGFKELRLNDRKSDAFFHTRFSKSFSPRPRLLRLKSAGYMTTNKHTYVWRLDCVIGNACPAPAICQYFLW